MDCVHDIDISNSTIVYRNAPTAIDSATARINLTDVRLIPDKNKKTSLSSHPAQSAPLSPPFFYQKNCYTLQKNHYFCSVFFVYIPTTQVTYMSVGMFLTTFADTSLPVGT